MVPLAASTPRITTVQTDRPISVLEDLGRRHAEYGVVDGQHETVGEALLWTLEKGLSLKQSASARSLNASSRREGC